jgi:hypothetical protein
VGPHTLRKESFDENGRDSLSTVLGAAWLYRSCPAGYIEHVPRLDIAEFSLLHKPAFRHSIMPAKMGFTIDQISAMEITERVCSILSLLGAAFVIGTFMFDKSFHRPINRLVFYASWGNVMANIGTLISVSGIHLGIDGPLCQFQAFLVQWYVGVALGHGIVH